MLKKSKEVTGFQVAFLVFTVFFLSIPLVKYTGPWQEHHATALGRAVFFGVAMTVLLGIPALRKASKAFLVIPITRGHRLEVFAVTLLHLITPFAFFGALALESWVQGGPAQLALRMGNVTRDMSPSVESQASAIALAFAFAGFTIAPVIEELVFRGFMYSAWARQLGWFMAMMLTALTFGIYHSFFAAAVTGSIIYTCLFRRTGALLAPIIVHCIYNLLLSSPLIGQFLLRPAGGDPSQLSSWWPQLLCFAASAVLIPMYVWMARRDSSR